MKPAFESQISRDPATLLPRELRSLCRSGAFSGPTAGLAPGYEQANLVMLPAELAPDFRQFCEVNPRPCPLIEMTGPGVFEPRCAPGADIRTDLPRYRVYRAGKLVDQPADVIKYCDDDGSSHTSLETGHSSLVSFLLGCSFTFESALLRAGIPVRHIEQGCNVSMYRTSIECARAGAFHGPMVVSMRPMTPEHIQRTRDITSRMPSAHGDPIHVGDPHAIGIERIDMPDYGEAVEIRPGEIPVFWACGVTPLEAILRAKPELAIAHEPGHMFVTDLFAGN